MPRCGCKPRDSAPSGERGKRKREKDQKRKAFAGGAAEFRRARGCPDVNFCRA
jgi:hypothetical protein